MGLFRLENRRLWRHLIADFQYLKGTYKKAGGGLQTSARSDRTRGNGSKLKEGRCRLNMRKKFFTTMVVKHWKKLPREVVDAPFLESVEGQAGWGLGQPDLMKDVPAHGKGVELDAL